MTKIRALAKEHPTPSFFTLTFLIAWSIWVPVGLFATQYFIASVISGAWAPTLAAIILTGLAEGRAGLREFIARLFRWRAGLRGIKSILMPVLYHAAINTTLGSTDAFGFVGGGGDMKLLVITVDLSNTPAPSSTPPLPTRLCSPPDPSAR